MLLCIQYCQLRKTCASSHPKIHYMNIFPPTFIIGNQKKTTPEGGFINHDKRGLCVVVLWAHCREQDHVTDSVGVGEQHCQAVDTDTLTRCWR